MTNYINSAYYRIFYISRLNGGEGGIRTPETLSSLHAFQACALNRARPPLRANRDYASGKPAGPLDHDTLDRASIIRLIALVCQTKQVSQEPVA